MELKHNHQIWQQQLPFIEKPNLLALGKALIDSRLYKIVGRSRSRVWRLGSGDSITILQVARTWT